MADRVAELSIEVSELKETIKVYNRTNEKLAQELAIEKRCTDLLRGMVMELLHRRTE